MTFNFAMQAMDQIVNSAAKTLYMSGGQMGAPIVFRGPNGAAARVGAQHSQDYAAWYAMIPGLKVAMPYSAADAKGLLKTAIRDPNPVIFLENEILYGRSFEVPDAGRFHRPVRQGEDLARRQGRHPGRRSASAWPTRSPPPTNWRKRASRPRSIDLRTLRPLDYGTVIESVKKTNRCVTVEEGFPVGAIGNHLSAYIMTHAFD